MPVFLSYAHGSQDHQDRVLALADRLRADGIDAILDQHQEAFPEGLPKWTDRHIAHDEFVLVICDETYYRRAMGEEVPGKGLGVRWESTLIYQQIYDAGSDNTRFIPVLLRPEDVAYIPTPLRGAKYYCLDTDEDYEALRLRLTGRPATPKPPLGALQRRQSFAQPWNVPHPRNPWFEGRQQILQDLRAALTGAGTTALTQAIAGLGGIGKTQTAVEFAYRFRNDYRAVLWTLADTDQALGSGFTRIAQLLDLSEKDAKDQNEIAAAVKRWLESNDGWLLIFDNADTPSLLKPYFPLHKKGHILVTSRAHNFDALGMGRPIELDVLTEDEAVRFLLHRTGSDAKTAAKDLSVELGCLPLALEQAAAFIVENQTRLEDYLQSFRKRRLDLLARHPPVAGDYPHSVLTTWTMNFTEVEKSPASADLLRFSTFLASDDIPLELITKGASTLGEPIASALRDVAKDPVALDELLEPLTRYSLIRRTVADHTYSIHRLVQIVVQHIMDDPTRRAWANRTVNALDAVFPPFEFRRWPECERLLPHALSSAPLVADWTIETPAAHLLNQAGGYLYERARYADAEQLFRLALAIHEKTLGPQHPNVAASLNNLALPLGSQGRYADAETLYRRALAIREKTLGPEHPHVAQALSNLAGSLYSQGQYAGAEPPQRRALAILEKTLGPEHPDAAQSAHNLAVLLKSQGRYADAEPLCRQALAIREKTLGADAPDFASSLNTLAGILLSQGRYTEAEALYRRALTIKENALGPEHPDVALSLNNLAFLLHTEKRYAEAEYLFRRALAIREKILGREHPDVATVLENLADLLRKSGRPAEVAPLEQRAASIRAQHARRNPPPQSRPPAPP